MRVYEAVIQGLVDEGVRRLFGLMGDGNMLVMAEAARRGEPAVFDARHEGAALTMAVGSAAVDGRVTACSVTCGPGLTQLGTALVDAVRGSASVVVIAGDLGATDAHINQHFVQRPFVESTGAAYYRVDATDELPDLLARAVFDARRGRPAVLALPLHLQDAELRFGWEYRPSLDQIPPAAPAMPDAETVARIAGELIAAERAVILAGAGAVGVGDDLIALADATGALLTTTLRAKGLFDGAPRNAGIAGAFSTNAARALLAEADVVLALGASLNYFTTEGGYLFPAARVISVDCGDPRPSGAQPIDELVRADANALVPALLAAVEACRSNALDGHDAALVGALRDEPAVEHKQPTRADRLHPVDVVAEFDRALDADTMVVVGVGHFWSFPIMYLTGRPPHLFKVTYDFGSIGQGLPTAIGCAAARPERPTVLFEGDGSIVMQIQELETLRRIGLPLLVVVMNDDGYGAEIHKLRAKGLDAAPAEFPPTEYAQVARAFGLRGTTITDLDALVASVAEFLAHPQPTLLDVRIDGDVISGPFLRSVFGRDE